LPMVDLVISHGGNNTLTETFSFGKPILVMPLFYDQFNNARRVQEKGLGEYLDAYNCTETELIESIDRLLSDRALAAKLDAMATRIRQSQSKVKACIEIERIAEAERQ